MTMAKALLCATKVGEEAPASASQVVVGPRIDPAYEECSAWLLEVFSQEVMACKDWDGWGISIAHFPAFTVFMGMYGLFREATLCDGVFERGVKEVVCACVSASVRVVGSSSCSG